MVVVRAEKGSVYVCGYLIERPPDACNEPTVWRELRCVHDGKMFGKKKSLSAGLHYLVALDDGALRGGVVWGKCALPGSSEWNHCGSKVGRGIVWESLTLWVGVKHLV